MKIQVNSDKTISVDVSLIRFVEGEVKRVLRHFATKITRVEVHLSDVDYRKTGQADKRCLIEVRPAGARPLSTSAKSTKLASAVGEASKKMQRLLATFFSRRGRTVVTVSRPDPTAKETVVSKTTLGTIKKSSMKKAAVKTQTKLSPRGPKKKGIYQARRKAWPAR
jgi:ribosome-associated translation inhibitor RaiA